MMTWRDDILPYGDAAVTVPIEVAGGLVENARAAQAVAAAIRRWRTEDPALGEPVPTAYSILVPFDPLATDAERVAALLEPRLRVDLTVDAHPGTLHRIPVRYGGHDGPDLEAVADELGLTPADVVDMHAATEVEVLFLGFAPGFAYLGELPASLARPRLATPRVRVPAGSVGIAGPMTAIYPQASPGGWRILGRTDVRLFDPAASPPARLRPGDRVRFEPA
jgi:KipI family sensor histidine kinase inhibitor